MSKRRTERYWAVGCDAHVPWLFTTRSEARGDQKEHADRWGLTCCKVYRVTLRRDGGEG